MPSVRTSSSWLQWGHADVGVEDVVGRRSIDGHVAALQWGHADVGVEDQPIAKTEHD